MPDFSHESRLARRLSAAQGPSSIVGLDEAGRGPWAGPVVAGACALDPDRLPADMQDAIDDSKALKRPAREALYERLAALPAARVGVGIASVEEIDRMNILAASLLAMRRAFDALAAPDAQGALVDGNRLPDLPCPAEALVKGDGKSLTIAAASIIAKVSRDRIMNALAETHPGYGWERNAGYGAAEHRAALDRLGVTPHHRRSFAPIAVRLAGAGGA